MNFQLRLLKMLSRVGRHVDDAQEVVTALAKKPVSRLTVYTKQGTLSWEMRGPNPSWREFLKWYHGRPQSECFVVNVHNGQESFMRKNVERYTIRNWSE